MHPFPFCLFFTLFRRRRLDGRLIYPDRKTHTQHQNKKTKVCRTVQYLRQCFHFNPVRSLLYSVTISYMICYILKFLIRIHLENSLQNKNQSSMNINCKRFTMLLCTNSAYHVMSFSIISLVAPHPRICTTNS